MRTHADLEIGIHCRSGDHYSVELRFSDPESDVDIRTNRDPANVEFPFERLTALALDPQAYGRLLGQTLLADPDVRELYDQARAVAEEKAVPLRLRLLIGPTALELHGLRWETLIDPEDDLPFITGDRLLFSRYLSSMDWRPATLRSLDSLRALVMVANPADLGDWQPDGRPLAPVDVAGELARARAGLDRIPLTELASGGNATLDKLAGSLLDGFDILYLVCHGALRDDKPWLWLENASGKTAVVDGSELVARLKEMLHPPRLVVLASCQSAGQGGQARSDDGGALSALGPRLAEAGVPAVIAMQGNISMQTMEAFIPALFQELWRDGQVDQAMTRARGQVRARPDWWVPVLYMRLRSGRLWQVGGAVGRRRQLEKWPALLSNIRHGRCTPIIGPGLTESLLGSRRSIARRWAETYDFPMSARDRDALPQVAQYLTVKQERLFPQYALIDHLQREAWQKYGPDLPQELRKAPAHKILAAASARRRERDPGEPHRILAGLPFPLYVTASYLNLLSDALTEAGRTPDVEMCAWNEALANPAPAGDGTAYRRPSVERPLVYQLFGTLDNPDSLVLTEDNYFDFLIGITGNKNSIPPVVRRMLTDTGLLFLGFQMDDWEFRVLFRSLMSQEGRGRRSDYAHVAVQISPDDEHIEDPERARSHLESYFRGADISIYWGAVEEFIQELQRRWEKEER